MWGKDFEHGWCISLLSGSYLEPQNPQTSPGPVVLHCQNCFARQGSNESCFVALFWMGWLLSTITALCVCGWFWCSILSIYICDISIFWFTQRKWSISYYLILVLAIFPMKCSATDSRGTFWALFSFWTKSDISRWSLWSPKQQHVLWNFDVWSVVLAPVVGFFICSLHSAFKSDPWRLSEL